MRLIIAGSRSITDYVLVCKAIGQTLSALGITSLVDIEVVSGGAVGVDSLGERWADENCVEKRIFFPAWDDLVTQPVKIKTNKFGKKYNALAGFNRNEKMANYANVLLAVWDGKSSGTEDMIDRRSKKGRSCYIYSTVNGKLAKIK
jgi:hypothetical protein